MTKLLPWCIFICTCLCIGRIAKCFSGIKKTRKRTVRELVIIIVYLLLIVNMFHMMENSSEWFDTPE